MQKNTSTEFTTFLYNKRDTLFINGLVCTPSHGALPCSAWPCGRTFAFQSQRFVEDVVNLPFDMRFSLYTWFPREGTVWCTIHWASTTPIFSWAGCLRGRRRERVRREIKERGNVIHSIEKMALTSTHFLRAKSRPHPWTKSFCSIATLPVTFQIFNRVKYVMCVCVELTVKETLW